MHFIANTISFHFNMPRPSGAPKKAGSKYEMGKVPFSSTGPEAQRVRELLLAGENGMDDKPKDIWDRTIWLQAYKLSGLRSFLNRAKPIILKEKQMHKLFLLFCFYFYTNIL